MGGILLLTASVNATTLGIEYMRNGQEQRWAEAWASELTSVVAVGVLLPFLFTLLNRLNLELRNLRWRILWLIPVFAGFSLAHISLFVMARKVLWAATGSEYIFDPMLFGLVYEMRKDFMSFLIIVFAYFSYRFIINRLQGEAHFLEQESGNAPENYRNQFLVKMLDREYLVKVDDIDWIQSAGNYVLLNCGERHYPMRQTLKSLDEQLDPTRFKRVHRTAIVNLDRVDSLQDKGETELVLVTGDAVPVSKTYLPQLRNVLTQPHLTIPKT